MQKPYSHTLQIKEQLEAVEEEVENVEIVLTTLNGLMGSWDSFIEGICFGNKWLLSADSGKKKKLDS